MPADPATLFRLDAVIGQGTYGTVYQGVALKSGKQVAVKLISYESNMEQLTREITILRECSNAFIVRYYGSYLDKNSRNLWIVMEHCLGSSLEFMVASGRPLDEPLLSEVVAGTALGLQYLHENGKIHRDVKAGNILLTKEGGVKLTDFGVSAQLSKETVQRETVIGTANWMAPEVLRGMKYGKEVDIWSLGVTCIELAQMHPPLWDKPTTKVIFEIAEEGRPPPGLSEPEKWSPHFRDFIALCLKKKPSERPTVGELLSDPFIASAAQRLREAKNASESLLRFMERLQGAVVSRRRGLRSSLVGGPSLGARGSVESPLSGDGEGEDEPAPPPIQSIQPPEVNAPSPLLPQPSQVRKFSAPLKTPTRKKTPPKRGIERASPSDPSATSASESASSEVTQSSIAALKQSLSREELLVRIERQYEEELSALRAKYESLRKLAAD